MVESMARIRESLIEAGLLPRIELDASLTDADGSDCDLLSLIVEHCRLQVDAANSKSEHKLAAEKLNWLEQQQCWGAKLTLGLPGSAKSRLRRWVGERLAWWPNGIPDGRRIGLVSSRLGRDLDPKDDWFTWLRGACAQVNPEDELLLTVRSTAAARFVERCGELFGLRVLAVDIDEDNGASFGKWGNRIRSIDEDEPTSAATETVGTSDVVSLSPPLRPMQDECVTVNELASLPVRDRVLVAASDRLLVLQVRPRGQVETLARQRLADPESPLASVYVALEPALIPTIAATEFQDAGAVGWVVLPPTADDDSADRESAECPGVVSVPDDTDWCYLTHCTRQRHGPWPGQAEFDYLDDLILDRDGADHSSLAALCRIVNQQRLIASSQNIRGGHQVVSFTAVPLGRLHELRTFRSHLARWDFEPFGICIKREWLERLGVRPVRYGDDELWQSLSPDEQPFFQVAQSSTKSGQQQIDWSVECEWRHVGDVDLRQLPNDAALLFTPSDADARQLASISRWPISVVASEA